MTQENLASGGRTERGELSLALDLRELAESMKHSAGTWMVPGWDGWKVAELLDRAHAALTERAESRERCPDCKGSGLLPNITPQMRWPWCERCSGAGTVRMKTPQGPNGHMCGMQGFDGMRDECPTCEANRRTAGTQKAHPADQLGAFNRWYVRKHGFAADHREPAVVRQFEVWCAAASAAPVSLSEGRE